MIYRNKHLSFKAWPRAVCVRAVPRCALRVGWNLYSAGGSTAACTDKLFATVFCYLELGSSVSIVSDYGLDNRAIGVRSSAGAKYFPSSLCVQTGSGVHPASCTMGTGGHFPGAKRGRGVTLTTHPHLMPRSRMSRSYISSHPSATIACSGTALLCILLITKIFKILKYTFYILIKAICYIIFLY
jgi:hypothetical protein